MSMKHPGTSAIETKGLWGAYKWLILRRLSQAFFLALFLVGPISGYWLVKGTLASSLTLGVLPLTDPFIFLQSLLAGHVMETSAIIGVLILSAAYFIVGGRVYCSWVCPVNVVSDSASWLRRRLGWKKTGIKLPRQSALWVMAGVFVTSFVSATLVWEFFNPVTILHRSIVFGAFTTVAFIAGVMFLIELIGGDRIWCSRLCPVGAFYGLIGKVSLVKISAKNRKACNDCMDCYAVCPEAHVISPALKGEKDQNGPVILSGDCTNCARCLDVCSEHVFEFSLRTKNTMDDVRPFEGDADKDSTKAA
ncbi:quinol dehydrogenase ferredoxin subunit NapH [Terasakiella pusilla]|uniref:quinol dehydrogenase ferredoxin subunit NapH n=1 Tax=Terasakiella pusilla TaxID=64973 RepID=UPI003AA92CF3